MKQFLITLAVGIFIGWTIADVNINRVARKNAEKEIMQTELGDKLKTAHFIDSINTSMINERVNEQVALERNFLELASRYKDYTSEGMAKEIIKIVSGHQGD
ncbi:hypothetical protein [Phocaeicola sp.]